MKEDTEKAEFHSFTAYQPPAQCPCGLAPGTAKPALGSTQHLEVFEVPSDTTHLIILGSWTTLLAKQGSRHLPVTGSNTPEEVKGDLPETSHDSLRGGGTPGASAELVMFHFFTG